MTIPSWGRRSRISCFVLMSWKRCQRKKTLFNDIKRYIKGFGEFDAHNSYHAAASMASCAAASRSHRCRSSLSCSWRRHSSLLRSVALPSRTWDTRRTISSLQACSTDSSWGPSRLIRSSWTNSAFSDLDRAEICERNWSSASVLMTASENTGSMLFRTQDGHKMSR